MAKHRPQSPTRGRWLVLQMLQPKGPHGPCRQQASNSYGGRESEGRWVGPQASDQSLTAGRQGLA